MDAVFFNALVRTACGGALATQAPTHLVQRDVELALPIGLAAEFKGGGEC